MQTRYPHPLKPGDRVVVTAPSSGVEPALHARLDRVIGHLQRQGYVVEEGRCLRAQVRSASAPADDRAAELMHTLLREDVAALLPPWGGELAMDLLDRLDWHALSGARPKWVMGYSDTSTWLVPLTLRLGWATAHGPGLMDLVAGQNDPLTRAAIAVLGTAPGGVVRQRASTHWQRQWTDFAVDPDSTYRLTEPTAWRALRGAEAGQGGAAPGELTFSGRLIGGCIDTLMHTAGTVHGDVAAFIQHHRAEGTVLYLENSGLSPTDWVRALHRLRWAGWLQGLAGVLVGRSAAADTTGATELRYEEALHHTLGALPCPVLVDMDIGHRPPQLVLVNGAWARVSLAADGRGAIEQHFS